MNHTLLSIGLLLTAKHFIADGPLQMEYMYMNKGRLGHPGGILHALLHGFLTFLILVWFVGPLAIWLGCADMCIHYFVDLLKVRLTAKYAWSKMARDVESLKCLAIYSDWYFYALIADQCLHFATYIAILAVVVR